MHCLPEEVFGVSQTWIDPLIAARMKFNITDKWFGAVLADFGGFHIGTDQTWQVVATVGYRINESWTLQGGYRHLDIDAEIDDREFDLQLSGPIFGATYRF